MQALVLSAMYILLVLTLIMCYFYFYFTDEEKRGLRTHN